MANYIDGFVLPVPRVRLDEYRRLVASARSDGFDADRRSLVRTIRHVTGEAEASNAQSAEEPFEALVRTIVAANSPVTVPVALASGRFCAVITL